MLVLSVPVHSVCVLPNIPQHKIYCTRKLAKYTQWYESSFSHSVLLLWYTIVHRNICVRVYVSHEYGKYRYLLKLPTLIYKIMSHDHMIAFSFFHTIIHGSTVPVHRNVDWDTEILKSESFIVISWSLMHTFVYLRMLMLSKTHAKKKCNFSAPTSSLSSRRDVWRREPHNYDPTTLCW